MDPSTTDIYTAGYSKGFRNGYLEAIADLRVISGALDTDLRRNQDGMPEGHHLIINGLRNSIQKLISDFVTNGSKKLAGNLTRTE